MIPKNPLVSVICLCYNHNLFVIDSLNSVINQVYNNIELIIVDDYSKDNSAELIKNWLESHSSAKFIKNEFNLGNTKSFNKALKFAKGDYIIDLATDDILQPNCIMFQLECFKNSLFKNLGIVYGNVELISENGNFDSYYFEVNNAKKVIKKRITGNIYHSIISGGNSLCSVSAMVKKEVFDKLNGYDENLFYEDLDFWIRASRDFEFDFIDEILVKKRIVQNSLGKQFYLNNIFSKKINYSTFLILEKTIKLNKYKNEHRALLKRIHFEMILNFKTSNFNLILRYLILEIKIRKKLLKSN